MKLKAIILIVMIVFSGISGLHANNKKANRYFKMYKYSKAIPLYKKSLSSENVNERREAFERLGDCYRLMNDVMEAQSWYSRATAFKNVNPEVYFYLGQTLQSTEQYDDAKSAYEQYYALKPADPKGRILAAFCDSIKTLLDLPLAAEIKNVASVNTQYSEMGPVFYNLGLIFASDRLSGSGNEITYDWTSNSYYDLYYAEPRYYQNYWMDMSETDRMSKDFNQTYHDGPVCFTSDFNTAFLTRTINAKVIKDNDNIRTNRLKLFSAVREDGKKLVFKPLPFNSASSSTGHPAVSGDGKRIIFSSDMPGGFGGSDLYYAENQNGKWSVPQNLGGDINTFGNEVFPTWLNDSVLFFSSDGHLGFGGLDLFEVHRENNHWGKPINMLKPLNSSYDDFGIALNPDKKSGFFSSDRPGGKGSDDIYTFRNYKRITPEKAPLPTKPEVKQNMVCGYVLDKRNRNPLGNATVFLFKTGTGDVLIAKTDPLGYYCFPVDLQSKYIVKAMKDEYFDDCLSFTLEKEGSGASQPVGEPLLLDRYALNQTFVLENIFYDLNKWNIRNDAEPPLDKLVQIMERNPISIELSSHTDSRGSDSYNLLLSQRRAESARSYITGKGINPARITARGYGELRLVNLCTNGVACSEKEHQANRRTEFKITSIESPQMEKQSIDLNAFKGGDILTINRFDNGFFSGCSSTQQTSPPGNDMSFPVVVKKPNEVSVPNTANATQNTSTVILQEETYFTVQIAAARAGSTYKMDFKGETVFSKEINEYKKFYIGKYQDYQSAAVQRTRIAGKFPGAFVVAFKDGNVIPVNELKGILK